MTLQGETPKFRINDISLGPFERRVLPWMAKRLPAWVVPDHLTAVAQFAAVLIGCSYWLTTYGLSWLWLANFGLILHWWGDSLDGTLARVRHIERNRYGFYVDHNSDTLAVFIICFGMGLSPLMDMRVALLLVISYYALMTLVNLVSMTRGVFKISFGGIGPTEIRLLIFLSNIAILFIGNPHYIVGRYHFTLYSLIGLVIAAGMGGYYLVFSEIERRRIAVLDPPPKPTLETAPETKAEPKVTVAK